MNRCKIYVGILMASMLVSELAGQEIIGVEEVKPGMRILVRNPNDVVYITNVDSIANIESIFSPKNFQLLNNPQILENVELSDSQKKQLDEIRILTKEKAKELSDGLKQKLALESTAKGKLKVAKEFAEKWNEFGDEISAKLGNDLIPFQSKLLDRYNFQQSMNRYGLGRTVLTNPWKENLVIDKKQSKEIELLNDEMNAEIKKQVAKIKAETNKKIKKLLNKKQTDIIAELEQPLKKR